MFSSILPFLGSALSSGLNFGSQMMTNQAQEQLADKQMSFQQQMSNTAYQRSVADMKAAGLNPMMMFGSGGPASVPGGAMAPLKAPQVEDMGEALRRSASTAAEVSVKDKTIDLLSSDIANRNADTVNKLHTTDAIDAGTAVDRAQKRLVDARTDAERQGIAIKTLDELRTKNIIEAIDPATLKWLHAIAYGTGEAGNLIGGVVDTISKRFAPMASGASAGARAAARQGVDVQVRPPGTTQSIPGGVTGRGPITSKMRWPSGRPMGTYDAQ